MNWLLVLLAVHLIPLTVLATRVAILKLLGCLMCAECDSGAEESAHGHLSAECAGGSRDVELSSSFDREPLLDRTNYVGI